MRTEERGVWIVEVDAQRSRHCEIYTVLVVPLKALECPLNSWVKIREVADEKDQWASHLPESVFSSE